jgi:hypothetical protein
MAGLFRDSRFAANARALANFFSQRAARRRTAGDEKSIARLNPVISYPER